MIYLMTETLNVNNQKYYFYNSVTPQVLIDNFKINNWTFTEDNYRINNDILRIKADPHSSGDFSYANGAQVHTVVHTIPSQAYYRVYNVTGYICQSNYVLFNLKLDLWHTYIGWASYIKNVRVTKCTRDLLKSTQHMGFYDNPQQALKSPVYTNVDYTSLINTGVHIPFDSNAKVKLKNLAVVFALKYNTYESNSGSVSRVQMFGFNLEDLVASYVGIVDSDTCFAQTDLLQMIIDTIAGIYTINRQTALNTYEDFSASVIGAWLIDAELINLVNQPSDYQTLFVRSKNSYKFSVGGTWSNQLLAPQIVTPANRERVFNITTVKQDANKQIYFGTKYNNLRIIKNVGTAQVVIKCIVNSSEIKIMAIQGENQEDITSAFALTLTTLDGDVNNAKDAMEKLTSALAIVGSLGTAIVGAISGNGLVAAGGVLSATAQATKFAESFMQRRLGGIGKVGDAYITYYNGTKVTRTYTDLYLNNPYNICKIEDDTTGIDNLAYYGLTYDYTVSNLYSIFSASRIETTVDDFDFLQCTDMTFDTINIPLDAQEYIRKKLCEGIRCKTLSTPTPTP